MDHKSLRFNLPETNGSPLKIGRGTQKETIIFLPSIFRRENVSFREGKR